MKHGIGEIVNHRFLVRKHVGCDLDSERYEVLDLLTNRPFDLLICNPIASGSKSQEQSHERMALKAISLTHENIAPVYATFRGEAGGLIILVDRHRGQTLTDLLKRESVLPIDQTLSVLIQIAQALSYAHDSGCLHRHLTPAAVQITEGPSQEYHAKLMNFGLDELTDFKWADGARQLWKSRRLWQHVHYVSPEQGRFGTLSKQTDIYSFGCIMFEMLSGAPPFRGASAGSVVWKQISEDIPLLTNALQEHQQLQKVVNQCLDKDPSKRYANAGMLVLDLVRIREARLKKPGGVGGKENRVSKTNLVAARLKAIISLVRRAITRFCRCSLSLLCDL